MDLIFLIPFCIGFYLLGNISPSLIVSWAKRKDLRKVGSGNAGTTNMVRAFGFKLAVPVLILDILKGVIPGLVGFFVFNDYYLAMLALGLSTVLGHCFPVLMKFKGGKGAATITGLFLVVNPVTTSIIFTTCLLIFFIFEKASISSILLMCTIAVWEIVHIDSSNATAIASIGLLIIFMLLILFTHRTNVVSLLGGTEKRISIISKLKARKKKTQR